MIIELNRQGVTTVGEASKLSRSLFGRLIFYNRERDFPPTAGLRSSWQA